MECKGGWVMRKILSIVLAFMLITVVVEARRLGKIDVQGLHTTENGSILAGAGCSGVLTLGGTGGSNNENINIDFETTSNKVKIDSSTGAIVGFDDEIIVGGASAGQSIVAAGLTVNDDSGGGVNDDFIAETNAQALAFQVDASAEQININVLMVLEHKTGDPCSSGAPEGAVFWNATAKEACVCDGTNDVRLKDASTACF